LNRLVALFEELDGQFLPMLDVVFTFVDEEKLVRA